MSELDLIVPPQRVKVTFALSPAYNALCSLFLLNSELSGHSAWVTQTVAALSPEQRGTNELVCGASAAYLEGKSWPSFPSWLDDLAQRDPVAMRDQELDMILCKAADLLDTDADQLPDRDTLIQDQATYLSLMERLMECKGEACDEAHCEDAHARLQDPVARQEEMVAHLRAMWDGYLAGEWAHTLPMLQEAIAAFESLDYSGKSVAEIIPLVTDRELTPTLEQVSKETDELIFVPSPHIGPYLLLMGHCDGQTRIVFGARIPKGAAIRSPALSRSELLMRLSALADDTRLRILELVANAGELRAQDIIARLELSQSASSRHLRQLSATGYLAERRCEGAKCYCLNRDRMEDTFSALQAFLQ